MQILAFFYNYAWTITAKNLQKLLIIDWSGEIKLSILKSRLKNLSKKWMLYTSGKKRTYMRDLATDKPCFWPEIGEAFVKSLKKLFEDAKAREGIMNIIINNCEIQDWDIDSMCDNFQKLEKCIDIYNLIVIEIKTKDLYEADRWYNELRRENMANRYSNPNNKKPKK
jgi:hypothetical protein